MLCAIEITSLLRRARSVVGILLAFFFVLFLLSAQASADQSASPPRFKIHLLGLKGGVNTFPDGSSSAGIYTGDPGITASAIPGLSGRYTTADAGADVWLFTRWDQQIRQIGLQDPDYYTPPYAQHRSEISHVNSAGQVAGYTSTDPTSSAGRRHAWYFDPATEATTRIGYTTFPEASPNIQDRAQFLLEDGFVAGVSSVNLGGTARYAWIYDPAVGTTQLVGLPESTDVGPGTGFINFTVEAVTPSRLVVGTAEKNSSSTGLLGTAVWVHRPGAEQSERIGLFGPGYARNNLQQSASFAGVNDHGLVVGRSEFVGTTLSGATFNSSAAWVYDRHTGVSTPIGLANPNDGKAYWDQFVSLTESNHAVGWSTLGSTRLTWVYDHATATTRLAGLRDERHTDGTGRTSSSLVDSTETGFVLGQSLRTENQLLIGGNSTWVYSPLTGETTEVGLFSGGSRMLSEGYAINRSGQTIGSSFAGPRQQGKPWFYDSQTGESIPLTSDIFQVHDVRRSIPHTLNEAGLVMGISDTNDVGDIVWIYDHQTGQTETQFDFRDAFTHDSSNHHVTITLHTLTETGLVLGSSERHQDNGADAGHTPWLFDSRTGETHGLVFSQSSRGQALTHIGYLSDDGVVLGEYDHFSPSDERTRRYFYWSTEHGFHDLETLIDGDLTALGWDALSPLASLTPGGVMRTGNIFAHDSSFLWGYGTRSGGYQMPFALVQIPARVPEPGAWLLVVPAAALLLARRVWRHSS